MYKKYLNILFASMGILLIAILFNKTSKTEPTTITHSGSIEFITLDEKISKAELILLGEARTTLPSKWIAPNGKDLKNATPNEIFESGGLFIDTIISVERIIKGSFDQPIVRVRSFIGETEKVRWEDSRQVSYEKG